MIKINNHIRFGHNIYTVDSINNDQYLLKEQKSGIISWVPKEDLLNSLEKLSFQSFLKEGQTDDNYLFKNDYLTVSINPCEEGSRITVLTESSSYSKDYKRSTRLTLDDFRYNFKYYNELTPHKLLKNGFKVTKKEA